MAKAKLTPILVVTNQAGRSFIVRLLPTGALYGRSNSLVIDQTTVEFYDATYADDGSVSFSFGPLGQFVSRYYLDTLLKDDFEGRGLCLYGAEPVWSIDGPTMAQVTQWLKEQEQKLAVPTAS